MSRRLARRARPAVVAAALLVLGACGGGSGASRAEPACVPSGNRLVISADNLEFDRSCLAAPPDQPFSIDFTNDESLPHNVEIRREGQSSGRVFLGEIFSGKKTVTYEVPPVPPGTYDFLCTVHPQMKGTVRVG